MIRAILHVDMDAFYASVEIRERPELADRPVVVGGDPNGRGVVAAASYAVRRHGVHSAMPSAEARRRCPDTVFIRPRMALYARESARLREILERFTPVIEPLSLDEAFLDVTDSVRLHGEADSIARKIKAAVAHELELVASIGVAPNKFLAKIASDLDKPDGLVVVSADSVATFLAPLPVSRIWGVGQVAERRLAALGVRTIGELRREQPRRLAAAFGGHAERLVALANGLDDRPVIAESLAKSLSHETTFDVDLVNFDALRARALDLTEQVAARLRGQSLVGAVAALKLRYGDFSTVHRRRHLTRPTARTDELWKVALELLERQWRTRADPVRLIGIGAEDLRASGAAPRGGNRWTGAGQQDDLFHDATDEQAVELDVLSDALNGRYGRGTVKRAAALGSSVAPGPGTRRDAVRDVDLDKGQDC